MKWLETAVFYQIYPQSFSDSNGDGIGDFMGIISKLDYIYETGFNAIWINPCFESPFYDAGYDITNFYKTAPRYGSNEDIKQLFIAAKKMGIHVILDLVPGHTSHLHPWFKESMKQEKNEYSDRYVWTDYTGRNVDGILGVNGWLRAISDRNGAVAVNYKACQPALNFGFAEITDTVNDWQQRPDAEGPRKNIEEMKKIMSFWLDMGCDGFRVDMAGSLVKNDDNQEETIKIWKNINRYIHSKYPHAVLISEWGEPTRALRGGFDGDFLLSFGPSHYMDLFRNEKMLDFDSDTHYFSKSGNGDLTNFKTAYKLFYEQTKKGGMVCVPSGNHDIPRLSAQLDDDEIKLAFAFLLTLPGAPFVYYGDEIGMRYIRDIPSKEGGYHRTSSRTPMQWDDSLNAGFSAAPAEELYLPVDTNENRPCVSRQKADESSIYNTVKRLLKLRRAHAGLGNTADFEFVELSENRYPLAYLRSGDNERFLVVINPSAKAIECKKIDFENIVFSIGECVKNVDDKMVVAACSAFVAKLK